MSAAPLIIPVENQVRELDAKLLLAGVATEQGFPVILGSRAFVHHAVASVPRGVYLAKSMRRRSDRMFDILRKLGHEIVAWDEEGLVRFPDAEYHRRRLSRRAMEDVAHFMAWGEDNAAALRACPGYPGVPVHVTGNPRIDLMRPELRGFYAADAARLRARYGPFLLVNTNFSQVNHFYAHLGEMQAAIDGHGPAAGDEFAVGRGRLKLRLFADFRTMLPHLCRAFPERTIVLRPHPSERPDPWVALGAEHPNLTVINEGSVVPWLLATRALIANGCTTLIEAAVLGLPAIHYRPLAAPDFEDALPRPFGHAAANVEEVIELVRAILRGEVGGTPTPVQQTLLARHIAAMSGPLAAERMVQVLGAAGYDRNPPPRPRLTGWVEGWLRHRVRTVRKRANFRRPGHRNNLEFHDHRFPPVSAAELQQRIERLGALLGRFQDVRVEQTSPHLYRIDGPRRTPAPLFPAAPPCPHCR